MKQFDHFLEFLRECVPQLLPPEVTTPSALKQLRLQYEHLHTSLYNKMREHIITNPDYMAIGHTNLNIDNVTERGLNAPCALLLLSD